MKSLALLVAAVLAVSVQADIYLQMGRGSNNRLNEANRQRNNANRMFDSQNNNRGGYNVGSTYYYVASTFNMEWTNQHSCGGPNNGCEVIIQYMCDDLLRDGTTTNTIPENADKNVQFGRHESWAYYSKGCKWRSRNKGLFLANRQLDGNGAIYTRQNEDGDRFGYECAEERDYYPYWSPTPWKDIAILTNYPGRCPAYKAESQNVKSRFYCETPPNWTATRANQGQTGFIPINQTECEAIVSTTDIDPVTNSSALGVWTEVPSWDIAAPECYDAMQTRDNHLGNVAGGAPFSFNWTVADNVHERCVVRIRYNVTTSDYSPWASTTSVEPPANLTRANNTIPRNNDNSRDAAKIDVWSRFRLSYADVEPSMNLNTNDRNGAAIKASRDYVWKNNPRVDIFGNELVPRGADTTAPKMVRLQLAMNTNQYARTFEDRTHRFAIRARPDGIPGDARIHNLNVRGKRGNIVQTYPGTEYDFFPVRLHAARGQWIHFQWTGSNSNPDNNAGQGKAGTDRHNAVLLRAPNYFEFGQHETIPPTVGHWGNNYPSRIDGANATFFGLSKEDMITLATLGPFPQMGGDMDELDDAATYFDLGPREATANGIHHYVCTRNNNFSNRDQKAKIVVSDAVSTFGYLGAAGGEVASETGAGIYADPGALTGVVTISIFSSPPDSASSFSGAVDSWYVTITPIVLPLAEGQTVTVRVPYNNKPLVLPKMYRTDDMENGEWETVSASFKNGVAEAAVTRGGTYVVQTPINWGALVGIIVGGLAFVGLVVGGLYYKHRNQATGKSVNSKAPSNV